jgi:hypothetical protein
VKNIDSASFDTHPDWLWFWNKMGH